MDEPTSYDLRPPAGAVTVPPAGEQRLVGGRYRLSRRLGHGGMGTVWVAHDERVDREVAVKEPRVPDHLPDDQRDNVYRRMRREARAAARIAHPAVVTVHDVVIEDGRPWLVMELVRGESLAEVLDSGTIDSGEAARIGREVLAALTAAHEAGVLHRDVKPANVLLGRHERVVLTDFGIAQVEGEQGLTDTGSFVGSPEFIAPERALGQRPGPESDLWSLGVLLYLAVEGVSPFRRNNTVGTMQAVLSAEPPPPARADGPLAMLIMRLLRKEPSARPDGAEIRRELESVAKPPPPPALAQAAPVPPTGPPRGGVRQLLPRGAKGRAVLGGAAVAVVLTLLLVVVKPFGGHLPDGWEAHHEEDIGVFLAIPGEFERYEPEEEDATWVSYDSPDGIYSIYAWHRNPEERDALTSAGDQRSSMVGSADYVEAEGRFYEREFEQLDAAELSMLVRGEEGEPRVKTLHLFVSADGQDQLWHIRVLMPGEEGSAREYGEQLYEQVVDQLELRPQKQREPEGVDG